MKKRITSGVLAVLLVFGTMTPTMAVTSFAAESDAETQAITSQDDEIALIPHQPQISPLIPHQP